MSSDVRSKPSSSSSTSYSSLPARPVSTSVLMESVLFVYHLMVGMLTSLARNILPASMLNWAKDVKVIERNFRSPFSSLTIVTILMSRHRHPIVSLVLFYYCWPTFCFILLASLLQIHLQSFLNISHCRLPYQEENDFFLSQNQLKIKKNNSQYISNTRMTLFWWLEAAAGSGATFVKSWRSAARL